jgi:hypothetical protein
MGRIFPIVALTVIGTAAFLTAFFPRVLPSLTNSYYSLIRVKTRVAVEDYERTPVRLAGGCILLIEIVWLLHRVAIGKGF